MIKEFLENRDQVYNTYKVLKELSEEKSNKLTKIEWEKRDRISAIESEYSKKQTAVQKEISEKQAAVEAATEANKVRVEEMKGLMKLLLIKNNLENPVPSYDYQVEKALEQRTAKILGIDEFDFFELHYLVHPNKKPTNKFDLAVYLLPKHFRLKDYDMHKGLIGFHEAVFEKSFPKIKVAEEYFGKNYRKIIAPAVAWNNEMVEKTKGKTFDPIVEFDFKMLDFKGYSSSYQIMSISENSVQIRTHEWNRNVKEVIIFTFSIDKKKRVFNITTKEESIIKHMESILSGGRETTHFWIDNPVIISV